MADVEGAPDGSGIGDRAARDDPGRRETEAQRDDRNLAELLQELRVGALGVQVLFGFLLALPFTQRFDRLSSAQRALYLAALLLAALATALLVAPVAYHRWVFRRHQKGRLVRWANTVALLGLAAVALAVTLAVSLVVSYVEQGPVVPAVAAGTALTFAGLWFAHPWSRRRFYPRGAGPPPDFPAEDARPRAQGS